MKEQYKHIDKILPNGEFLRGFANQKLISEALLKQILRERGVFFGRDTKEVLVPFLCNTIITPKEFEILKDSFNTTEDSPKRAVSNLKIQTSKTLINVAPNNEVIEDFKTAMNNTPSNFKIAKILPFSAVGKGESKIFLEFEVERKDLNKSWFETTNRYKGKISVEKINDGKLIITRQTTSEETKKVAIELEKIFVKHLKETNAVDQKEELQKIYFGDFENKERIAFFLRLSNNIKSSHFEFEDISDVQFKADEAMNLPKEITWMSNKDALIFRGKKIQSDFFFTESEYHKYIKCWGMEVMLNYSYELVEGKISIRFGFPSFEKRGNRAEFEINIVKFTCQSDVSSAQKYKTKDKLFDLLEKVKTDTYNNFLRYMDGTKA